MANRQMDGFLEEVGGQPADAEIEAVAPIPEPEPDPAPPAAPEAKAPETPAAPAEAEPPAPEDAAGLLKALQAERTKRNDYKGERDRLKGELDAFKTRMEELERRAVAPPPPPAPPPQQAERVPFRAAPNPAEDPAGYAEWLADKQINDRANESEIVLRAEIGNDAEVNAKIALFQQAAAANPRLLRAARLHSDPYRYAFEQGQKVEAERAEQAKAAEVLKQVGSDPQAWIAQQQTEITARVRAELEAQYANAPMGAAPVVLPQSLGTARSAAPRQAVPTEEIPFADMFGQRKKRA